MSAATSKTIFHQSLSDDIVVEKAISREQAEKLFAFFQTNPLFKWRASHNDCEDRANAVCLLLDAWDIPNFKGWVFSGYFLKKNFGNLINRWNYHVAALLPVNENNSVQYYILDPATQDGLVQIETWAEHVTESPHSYYLLKNSDYYIFNGGKILKDNWHKRDRRNLRWTMQGLAGINALSSVGKAQLSFCKNWVKKTEAAFKVMKAAIQNSSKSPAADMDFSKV